MALTRGGLQMCRSLASRRNSGLAGGFTLIEVLISIILMVVLVAVATPFIRYGLDKAHMRKMHTELVQISAWVAQTVAGVTSLEEGKDYFVVNDADYSYVCWTDPNLFPDEHVLARYGIAPVTKTSDTGTTGLCLGYKTGGAVDALYESSGVTLVNYLEQIRGMVENYHTTTGNRVLFLINSSIFSNPTTIKMNLYMGVAVDNSDGFFNFMHGTTAVETYDTIFLKKDDGTWVDYYTDEPADSYSSPGSS